MRRDQIVSTSRRELQEFLRHLSTDQMKPDIAGPGVSTAVAMETGNRRLATNLQLTAEDILG